MLEEKTLYYLLAIFIGIVGSIIYLLCDRRGIKKHREKDEKIQKVISAYIRANNQGRPVDEVVDRMQKRKDRLAFSVDVFGDGDEVRL